MHNAKLCYLHTTGGSNPIKPIDKIHKLSLRGLTLSGVAALVCLAVNVVTALTMFVAERREKAA